MSKSTQMREGEGSWIVLEKAKIGMKIAVVKQVVSRGIQCLLMILVGYGSNDNSLR